MALMAYGSSTDGSYYDEELMAEWRLIFDPDNDKFKEDWEDRFGDSVPWTGYIVDAKIAPEKLRYWLDLIDTSSSLSKYSVNRIGRRSVIKEDSKINEVYSREITDIVFIEAPKTEAEWEIASERIQREYIPIG